MKQFLSTPDSDPLSHLSIDFGQTMAEAINDYFVGISQDFPPVDSKLLEQLTSDTANSEFIIEPYQVAIRLAKLNIYKAPGPDGLPTWLLRDCAPFISEPLAAIFNSSLRQGHFPAIWKSAEVIPVPKTNPPRRIDSDLRPISLLPVLAKVFESFIHDWVLDFLRPTLDPLQFGSLKGRSTLHALTSVLHSWQSALDKGHSVRALFVDYSKAFDRVNHNILLQKLLDRQVPHYLIKWLFSYLSNRQQRVRASGKTSTWKPLNGSMPQGSPLGPLTFLVMIDDLAPGCLTHKYVDDTTLTEIISSPTSDSHMPQYLQELTLWTQKNGMLINTAKTKELVIGRWDHQSNGLLSTQDGPIERVTEFKLLGVYVDSNLSWKKHIEYVTTKAAKRLYFLKVLKRSGLPHEHLLHYYTAVIRPVLEYCSCVWHHNLTEELSLQIETIQKRAIRVIFDCTRDMSYRNALYCAGLSSLHSRRTDQARGFFQSIMQPDSCIHVLLPPPRDPNLLSRLRNPRMYPVSSNKTKKYQSFVNYGLLHYQ